MVDKGIVKGDRVGVVGRNSVEYLVAFVGATLIGAVIVPLNSWWKPSELEYAIHDANLKLLFTDLQLYDRLTTVLPRTALITVIIPRNATYTIRTPNTTTFSDILLATPITPSQIHVTHDDIACIMYTSGSTGHPKGVTLTHRGICHCIFFARLAYDISPTAPVDVTLCPVPMFHVTASHHVFLQSLVKGGKIILMPKWDPLEALKTIQSEKVNRLTGVPTMMQDLMEHPKFSDYDCSSLKGLMAGGAPTPVRQVSQVGEKFQKAKAVSGYGLTETNGGVATINGKAFLKRPTSVGRPSPLVKFVVVKPGTVEEVGLGESGELLIKSCLLFQGYWGKVQATREALVTVPGKGYGWFRSGDIAKIDHEGYCYLLDRVKDIIIRGGENISCAEVESAFFHTNLFHEAACFGLRHSRYGEVPAILLRPKSSITPPTPLETRDLVAPHIAAFKIPLPEHIFFTDTPLPKGGTGKTLKRVIRDEYNKKFEGKL
eukprot:TRINITY_DN4700_c0_g1_i1.p1 TRINITY_DN4700_c0_g1~~TRINITY_DN4700_c0_g1_i1.p1  ORF type:complete len:498 (+),score=51.54 TRINITY_DN4700_c0_g1_i1:32-1495(+)